MALSTQEEQMAQTQTMTERKDIIKAQLYADVTTSITRTYLQQSAREASDR